MEDNQIERLEQFYTGQMEPEEEAAFRRELEKDEELQKQLSAYILAREAVETQHARQLREQMNDWDDKSPNSSGNGQRNDRRKWGLLLLVLALVAGVYVSCPQSSDLQPGTESADWDAYAQVQLRGIERSAEEEPSIQVLNQLYVDENYEAARLYKKELPDSLRNTAESRLIEGLLSYQAENFEIAANTFKELLKETDLHYTVEDAAQYFLLLAKIRMEDCSTACMSSLRRYADDDNFLYKKQSSLLLNKIQASEK